MTDSPPDPRALLPLTPLAFHVLLALAEEARHGYGIIREVDQRTDGLIRLRTGTLYTLLQRLLNERLIEPMRTPAPRPDDKPTRHDDRRRYYGLTGFGRAVLEAEARRLETLVLEARQKRVLGRASRA